jgi:hypothetical protein
MGVEDGELFSLEARVRALLGHPMQQEQQQQQSGIDVSHSKAATQQGGIDLVVAAGDSPPQ